MPGADAAQIARGRGAGSSQSRNSPTVSDGDRREGGGVVGVDDQPRDLVVFVGDDRLGEEGGQRQVGQRHLRGDPLGGGGGGDARPARRPSDAGVARASSVRRSAKT